MLLINLVIRKTLDEVDTIENLDDDLPKIRLINNSSIRRKHTKIPLAPPPIVLKRSTQQPDSLLSNLPDQYITKRPTMHNITDSPEKDETSLRKSSGSYSIYSTFGGDGSVYSVEINKKDESVDSFNTVVSTILDNNEDDDNNQDNDNNEDDDNNEEDDDSDDEFVDATGLSQEDIEREKRLEIQKNLSKRLSGGHFGSAGGLLLSINPESESMTPPPVPSIQPHRRSSTLAEDDELSKSMLNWKRHSDTSKRWSTAMRNLEDKHASTVTVIDLRTIETQKEVEEEEEQEEELSVPDVIALRKKAQDALSGDKPTLASLSTHESTTELFSKTLDDVWKTMDDNKLELFNDARTKEIQTSIQNSEDNSDKLDEKIKETALQLWKEDETTVTKERMAEWLGQG